MITRKNLPALIGHDRLFNEVFSDFFSDDEKWMKASRVISCDIREVDGHFVFSMDIPGVKKEDIKVEVKKGFLVVTATRDDETNSEEGHFVRQERRFGEFTRSFALSDDIDTDNIEASYENGVLHLALAKKAEEKTRYVDVKTEKSGLLGKLLG